MRIACATMKSTRDSVPNYLDSFSGMVVARQYVSVVTPEHVEGLLDMGEQMCDAIERINKIVAAAGFSNLEQALNAIGRIGEILHGNDIPT